MHKLQKKKKIIRLVTHCHARGANTKLKCGLQPQLQTDTWQRNFFLIASALQLAAMISRADLSVCA